MNKVTNINLNGKAYQLEEQAYEALQHYLHRAKTKLADDPDKDEILNDLEQAIAEKCDQHLQGRKNVVTTAEMKQIIEAMGPVEAADAEDTIPEDKATGDPPKRLYLLPDGAVIAGVCNGLAAYFNVDVTIVRLLFILLAFVTSCAWILVYVALMFVVPTAKTPEEKAAARGERFSAQDLMQRAKVKYADISREDHWKRVAQQSSPAFSRAGQAVRKLTRWLSGSAAVGLGIPLAMLAVAWIVGIWTLAFGNVRLDDQLQAISTWTVALGLTALFYSIFLPFMLLAEAFRRYAMARKVSKQAARWGMAAVGLWVVALAVFLALVANNAGYVRDYQRTHDALHINNSQICINHCATRDGEPVEY
ncbi:MAG TPA: PspC domain-containing protein [Nevskiaceae bacterium]|nr:PspC domain-containing protein [Nevskiaceae bacterium]